MALSPSKLLLAGLGVLLINTAREILQRVFLIHDQRVKASAGWPEATQWIEQARQTWFFPGDSLWFPFRWLEYGELGGANLAAIVTLLLATFLIWGLIGGGIARLAGLHLAKGQHRSARYALRFAYRQGWSYLIAPLLPLSALTVLCLVLNAAGRVSSWIPGMGENVAGVLWGLWVVIGLAGVLLRWLVLFGWPLMVVAISTEDSDGFDGLSRSYGMILDRPWYALLLTIGAVVMGTLACQVLNVFLEITWQFTTSQLSLGFGAENNSSAFVFWRRAWSYLLPTYGVSYFWTSATLIYFLLRQSDDGSPLTQIATYRDEPS